MPLEQPPADGAYPGPEERQALVVRMRRIQGQARAVERMIAEGDTCERVLHQIAALRGALGRVAVELVACHLTQQFTSTPDDETRRALAHWLERLGV